jgi:hypothetical protein
MGSPISGEPIALLRLNVFAASAIEAEIDRTLVLHRLTRDAFLTPGRILRRASGISSPPSTQWVSLSPMGSLACALSTASMTVLSI